MYRAIVKIAAFDHSEDAYDDTCRCAKAKCAISPKSGTTARSVGTTISRAVKVLVTQRIDAAREASHRRTRPPGSGQIDGRANRWPWLRKGAQPCR